MRPIDADRLAVAQAADIVPYDLLVTEARPPVLLALINELLDSPAPRCNEEWLARYAVVVGDLATVRSNLLQPSAWALEAVAAMLGVLTVEAADPIGRRKVAAIHQVTLHRHPTRPVLLLCHDRFVSQYRVLA